MKITEKEFSDYVEVQKSGATNMFDRKMVLMLSGLGIQTIRDIQSQYSELAEKYPKVLKEYNS